MRSTKYLIAIIILITTFSKEVYAQSDTTNHNGIWEIGISHRFSSKSSNELGTDESGIQYNLDIGHEWNINSKNKLGFILSGQIISKNYDAYLAPMIIWNYVPNENWSHKLAAGPILMKSYNDEDFINGFSLSYDLEIADNVSFTNRFDILDDSKIGPIFSYSPGIELRGKYAKIFIITGTAVTGLGALIVLNGIRNSR